MRRLRLEEETHTDLNNMTNCRRPDHLQLRPRSIALAPCPPCSPCWPGTTIADSLPSQILPHLFVGEQGQTNKETVNRLNITYILSLGLMPLISTNSTPTSPTVHPLPTANTSIDFKIRVREPRSRQADGDENRGGIKVVRCKCINIADSSEQILTKFFDEAHLFIDEARRKKCNILVHCLAGISRSPTIAISYLMRVNSLRLDDAYKLAKQCRPQIEPNIGFMGQLMLYEKSLIESRDESANK